MTKHEFQTLLALSSDRALDFARIYVLDYLPQAFLYSVYLNSSFDDPDLKQFDHYPEDDNKIIEFINADDVVNLLARNGKIPVWIDISVKYVYKSCTVFQLLCAGRYTEEKSEFYYEKRGTAPFGIKSPFFPNDYVEGVKFKLPAVPEKDY